MPRTLLLADDSVTIQKAVQITFAVEDTQVVAVDNGEDALQKIREIRPDIIVADVVMPRRNGYDLSQAIKSEAELRHIPVLLLSGTFEPFDEARAAQVKADGYLVKPFDSQALIDKVNELTGGRPAAAASTAAAPPRAAPAPAQPAWTAPAPAAPQPFRPSAPAAQAPPAAFRTPAPVHAAPAVARPAGPPPVVPSLSPMPAMRSGPPTGTFSVSRPSAPSSLTPPVLGTQPVRPAVAPTSSPRPDPFAGLPPSGTPRIPLAPAATQVPLGVSPPRPAPPPARPAAPPPQAYQPPAPSRPAATWPGQPVPAQRPPLSAPTPVPRSPAPPPVASSPAPARPTLTAWDTLGVTPASAPPYAEPGPGGGAAFMAEAAAAATMQDGPGNLALDVPLEDDGTEPMSPLQAVSGPDASFDLGPSSGLFGGTLSDLAQTSSLPETGIDLGEDEGDFGDRVELAAPHEFMGGPTAPTPRPTAPAPATPARPAAIASSPPATGDVNEAALRAALSSASREMIERVVWEVVPQMVEVIVREHVERLAQAREK